MQPIGDLITLIVRVLNFDGSLVCISSYFHHQCEMLLNPRTILQSVIRRSLYNKSYEKKQDKYRPNMPLTSGALKIMQKTRTTKRERQGRSVPSNVYFQGKNQYNTDPVKFTFERIQVFRQYDISFIY